MRALRKSFGKLDVLVLNASGGLEKDKPASYAADLNVSAQINTLTAALPLMPAASNRFSPPTKSSRPARGPARTPWSRGFRSSRRSACASPS